MKEWKKYKYSIVSSLTRTNKHCRVICVSLRNFHLGLDNQSNVLCVVTGQTRPLSACYIWINLIVHLTSVCITPAPSPRRVATLLKLLAGRDNLTVQHDHVTECLLAVARRNIQCIWSYSNGRIQKYISACGK